VSRGSTVCALVWAVCIDLRSSTENPDLLSCWRLLTIYQGADETSVDFQQTTQQYIPEGSTLRSHRCDNLKSYINVVSWGGVRLSPLGTSATNCPIVPDPEDRW
jgi:hypothetical protein